jgi:hypothetical protein
MRVSHGKYLTIGKSETEHAEARGDDHRCVYITGRTQVSK